MCHPCMHEEEKCVVWCQGVNVDEQNSLTQIQFLVHDTWPGLCHRSS